VVEARDTRWGGTAERLAELRSEFAGDLEVSGPTLASALIERIGLRLLETRIFESGVTYLGYDAVQDRWATSRRQPGIPRAPETSRPAGWCAGWTIDA
jgi:hypothetical protein